MSGQGATTSGGQRGVGLICEPPAVCAQAVADPAAFVKPFEHSMLIFAMIYAVTGLTCTICASLHDLSVT